MPKWYAFYIMGVPQNWIPSILLLILFECIADIFSEEWSFKGQIIFWVIAFVFYFVAAIIWLYTIRHGSGLARGVIVFSVGSALVAVGLGYFFFKESLNKFQLIGIVLGLISLIFIFWEQ